MQAEADLSREIDRLTAAIDRAARAAEATLAFASRNREDPCPPLADRDELSCRLAALRERVARALDAGADPRAERSELATLLFFANALRDDAKAWRRGVKDRLEACERERAAARRERERLARELRELSARRDALQHAIVQTAQRMAQQHPGGECRRTVPIVTLGDGLSVCSVSVSCPRQGLHPPKHWLVTSNASRDGVRVRRR
jgi:chromosome segregation ATPase